MTTICSPMYTLNMCIHIVIRYPLSHAHEKQIKLRKIFYDSFMTETHCNLETIPCSLVNHVMGEDGKQQEGD